MGITRNAYLIIYMNLFISNLKYLFNYLKRLKITLSIQSYNMLSIKNQVQLIGNTGKEVELTTFESGSKKATVSFATSEYYKNTNGETVTNTQWHSLVAWGKTAEFLAKSTKKGESLIIKGSINYRTYEDKSGNTRYITEILVDQFMKTTKEPKEGTTQMSQPKILSN